MQKILTHLNISLSKAQLELEGKGLLKCVFRKWLDAADTILEMVTLKLPSPAQAQKYRVGNLYEGPLDDPCAIGIRDCD